MREELANYVKRVRELADHCRGNEQATKQTLIGPLFTLLGYDLTDPRECIPEFRADFGPDRSRKPVDWAFLQNSKPIFFVEAKDVSRKLTGYDEQLGDYFAKSPDAKLGILTNGVHWRFYSDTENQNILDKEPFVRWDVVNDDEPPVEFLTLLRKSQFNIELIRTLALRKRNQNLLVCELTRLLEPAPEFTKLAVAQLETRNLTQGVVDGWKPIVAHAINEWARQRILSSVLDQSAAIAAKGNDCAQAAIETTEEELAAFTMIQKILGPDRPIQYEDTLTYFKIHLPNQQFWAVCRLYQKKRRFLLMVPLPFEQVQPVTPMGMTSSAANAQWTTIPLINIAEIERVADILRTAYDQQWERRGKKPIDGEVD